MQLLIMSMQILREFGQARGSLVPRGQQSCALGDRTSADGKYLILGNEGSEFVVTDGKGVY